MYLPNHAPPNLNSTLYLPVSVCSSSIPEPHPSSILFPYVIRHSHLLHLPNVPIVIFRMMKSILVLRVSRVIYFAISLVPIVHSYVDPVSPDPPLCLSVTPSSSIKGAYGAIALSTPDIHQTQHRRREGGARRKSKFDTTYWRKIERTKNKHRTIEKGGEREEKGEGMEREEKKKREGKGHGHTVVVLMLVVIVVAVVK